ncbi:MAG: hypothetical protein LUF89_03505 [Ruminococcus sp.]|nr:hypothetical protein [Ruminococcus sp.]
MKPLKNKLRRWNFQKALTAFCLLFSLLFTTGCDAKIGASVDTLLKPPSLSEEQKQIYLALQDCVGDNITLQYPRSGNNLSAFTIADLDDDGEDEVLIFYKKTSLAAAENTLRVGVLNQVDEQWQVVCDIPADGAEIETVEISPMGAESRNRIFFGYSGTDQSDKLLTIYTYEDGMMTQLFTTNYTMFDVEDMDNDDQKELLVLTRTTDAANAAAAMYRLNTQENVNLSGKLDLRTSFTDYSQILYSKRSDNTPTIFVDGQSSTATVMTEIFCVSEGILAYVLENSEAVAATARTVGYISMDIDGDGSIEIPVQESFPGYEEDASDQVKLIRWLELNGNQLTEKTRGYFDLSDGCMFLLPKAWYETVTAITDALTGDIVFCRYDGEITDDMIELMRYGVVQEEEEIEDRESDGYLLIHTKGKAQYYFKAEDSDDSLTKDWKELLTCFRFI